YSEVLFALLSLDTSSWRGKFAESGKAQTHCTQTGAVFACSSGGGQLRSAGFAAGRFDGVVLLAEGTGFGRGFWGGFQQRFGEEKHHKSDSDEIHRIA